MGITLTSKVKRHVLVFWVKPQIWAINIALFIGGGSAGDDTGTSSYDFLLNPTTKLRAFLQRKKLSTERIKEYVLHNGYSVCHV